ncbi:hypothetical protein SPSYN_00953 [Sporotomaculum syntrophicum]|uniref:NTP pyrophosphohydrolase MazG putative catalytic core domain-containing protein n=1 Tax=Sporotomaculum syntrophicum TaxID=182264 RepID=A0A9D2WT92_9FIRM|nr:MazG-like family protein [Sporotomaculum syntrophicum]KAF1086212.1 hypothetical protein SPSYN_00953 [Sporotomaculum syntrophicum]
MTDATTNLKQLKDFVAIFVENSRLREYHNMEPSLLIDIETADLSHERVRDELIGLVIYCLSLANAAGIDLSSAIREKVVEILKGTQ